MIDSVLLGIRSAFYDLISVQGYASSILNEVACQNFGLLFGQRRQTPVVFDLMNKAVKFATWTDPDSEFFKLMLFTESRSPGPDRQLISHQLIGFRVA